MRHREKNSPLQAGRISASGGEVRILGIDPGNVNCGYGIVETCQSPPQANGCIYITSGNILNSHRRPSHVMLRELYDALVNIIRQYGPHEVVVEKIFFARNAKAALNLGQARGIALLAAASESMDVYEYSALEVKKAITGYGRAEKRQVQEMVMRILNLKLNPESSSRADLTEDAADALALAICHINSLKLRKAINRG